LLKKVAVNRSAPKLAAAAAAPTPATAPPAAIPTDTTTTTTTTITSSPILPTKIEEVPIGGLIPLTGVRYEVSIVDFCAQVTLLQRFENREENPIEAVYEFILEERVAVSGFFAKVENKLIAGVVQPKQKAKDTYDDAIAAGGGGFILEEDKDKPNVFSVSVGNLPPQKEVLVSITYVTDIGTLPEGHVVFLIPGAGTANTIVAPTLNTLYEKEIGTARFSINVSLEFGSPIETVTSSTHQLTVLPGEKPNKANVIVSAESATAKEFELQVKTTQTNDLTCRVQQYEDGSKVAMVSFFPKIEGDAICECIFVVDRSGSMGGKPIEQVKQTLQIFLRSLPEGTLFNIIGFGSNFMTLFPKESVLYNETTLDTATKYVEKMSANLGGTNILQPLMSIFAKQSKPGIPRQIFLLTDGQITNTTECINAVRNNANTTRVFTYGIGNDVDRALVRGLCRAGNGDCEFIRDTETMNEKVLKLLNKALQPALTNIKVSWSNQQHIKTTPSIFPPLFGGSRLIVYGLLPQDITKPISVTLSAMSNVTPVNVKVEVNPNEITHGVQIFKLAAKSLISYSSFFYHHFVKRDN